MLVCWNQATLVVMAEIAHQMKIATPVAALWDTQDMTVRQTLTIVMVLHVTMAEPVQTGLILIPVHVFWDTLVTNVRPNLTTVPVNLVGVAASVLMESILIHVPVWKTMRAAPVS